MEFKYDFKIICRFGVPYSAEKMWNIKREMRNIKKGNDLYIITLVGDNYSFLSDVRVV